LVEAHKNKNIRIDMSRKRERMKDWLGDRRGGEWMGADKNSSQELGLCPQITSQESRTHLPRSRSHNGPTDPRNKLDQA
jgi:hypothetical protein